MNISKQILGVSVAALLGMGSIGVANAVTDKELGKLFIENDMNMKDLPVLRCVGGDIRPGNDTLHSVLYKCGEPANNENTSVIYDIGFSEDRSVFYSYGLIFSGDKNTLVNINLTTFGSNSNRYKIYELWADYSDTWDDNLFSERRKL